MSSEPERRPPRAPMGGQLAWWPFLVALVGVLIVVVVVVLVGGGSTGSRQQGTGLTRSGAVACPRFFQQADTPWVPARPAGAHPGDKLVPALHPTHVTVCAYRGSSAKSLRLAGQRELTGKLDRVADSLRAVSVGKTVHFACNGTPPTQDTYLIGMRYAEAIVWVSAPAGPCLGTGNGSKYSHRNLNAIAAASYAARTWVSSAR